MRAFLVFSEGEPIVVMASRQAVRDGRLVDRLTRMGHERFIAHEVPVDELRRQYGVPFEVIESDIRSGKAIRVLDSDGRHIFDSVPLESLGPEIRYEGRAGAQAAGPM
jgi:hypothetical protein